MASSSRSLRRARRAPWRSARRDRISCPTGSGRPLLASPRPAWSASAYRGAAPKCMPKPSTALLQAPRVAAEPCRADVRLPAPGCGPRVGCGERYDGDPRAARGAQRNHAARRGALLRQALTRAEAAGDAAAMAAVADEYGGTWDRRGATRKRLSRSPEPSSCTGALGDQYGQAMAMAGNGRCYSCRAGRFDEAFRYATRVREMAEELADARLRAWRAMEAEPFMYQGAWADVVRVAEAALPGAWEIAEIESDSLRLGMARNRVRQARPARDDARRVVDRALREGAPGWESPGSCRGPSLPGPSCTCRSGKRTQLARRPAGTPARGAHPLPPRAWSSAPSPR